MCLLGVGKTPQPSTEATERRGEGREPPWLALLEMHLLGHLRALDSQPRAALRGLFALFVPLCAPVSASSHCLRARLREGATGPSP